MVYLEWVTVHKMTPAAKLGKASAVAAAARAGTKAGKSGGKGGWLVDFVEG